MSAQRLDVALSAWLYEYVQSTRIVISIGFRLSVIFLTFFVSKKSHKNKGRVPQ